MSGKLGSAGSRSGTIGRTELDYEEGTWTPQITTNSRETNQSYSLQSGNYIKTGKHIFAGFHVNLSAKNTMDGIYLAIAGLPFAMNTTYGEEATMLITYWSGFTANWTEVKGGYANAGSPFFYVLGRTGTGASSSNNWVAPSDIGNSCSLRGSMTYQTT